jgi:hypothetical protein
MTAEAVEVMNGTGYRPTVTWRIERVQQQRLNEASSMNCPKKQQPITRFMQNKKPDIVVVSSDHEAGNNAGPARSSPTAPMNGRRRRVIDSDDDGLDFTTAPASNATPGTPARVAQAPTRRIDDDHEDTDGNFAVILREPDIGQLPPRARHTTHPRQNELRRPSRSHIKRRRHEVCA